MFLKLNEELINIDDIFNVTKEKEIITINYLKGNCIIPYELDYSKVKKDVNKEKQKIDEDFELLEINLGIEKNQWIKLEEFIKLDKNYQKLDEKYYSVKDELYNLKFRIEKEKTINGMIRRILNDKKLFKIKRIKEVIYK